jgi:MFS family permease
VVLCALFQALCLFLLSFEFIIKSGGREGLILLLTAYWFFGLSAGPAWNAWVVSLVPNKRRYNFFALRGRIHEITILITLVLSGLLLNNFKGSLGIFNALFLIAAVSRILSAFFLFKQPAEPQSFEYESPLDFQRFKSWLNQKDVIGILIFLGLLRFGVSLSAPFFTPFFLIHLKYSYAEYMFIITLPFLSRAILFSYNEQVVKRFGIQKPLCLSVAIIGIIPLVWSLMPNMAILIFFQILGGWGWAIFEYTVLMRQINDFPPNERSRVLTWTNFLVGLCTLAGVVWGAELLGRNPNLDSYNLVFNLSTIFRLSPLMFIFLIDWKETRLEVRTVFFRLVGTRLNRAGESKPILYMEEKQDDTQIKKDVSK